LGVEVHILQSDVSETAEYYRDRLGFQIDFLFGEPANHAAVSRGEWTGSTVTIQFTRLPEGRRLKPSGYLYIFTDTRLDALCQDYRANGVEIVTDPQGNVLQWRAGGIDKSEFLELLRASNPSATKDL